MVYQFLEKNKNLSTEAVIYGEDKITYKELFRKSSLLGRKLSGEATDTIIICIPNNIYYVVSYFSILACDKIVYPISSLSKQDEVISAIERTGSNVILCTHDYYEQLKAMCQNSNIKIICVDNETLYDSNTDDLESICYDESKINDTCVLLNTSGSTDIHKIVMLTQKNIMTNCTDWVEGALDTSTHGKVLIAMPACTSFGTVVITTCVLLGWTIVFMPSFFNSATLLQTIGKEEITHLICIGSMLNILASDVAKLGPSNYNSLKFIGIGGNKAVPETMKIMMKYFPEVGLSPGYGITEATCIVSGIHPGISRNNKELFYEKIHSAGKPYRNSNVKIDNREGMPNSTGEILIGGPIVMKGYYNNTQATKAALNNGYLHTGDIGYFDEDGYLYVVGRIKNIIKSGGYTVFSEEIEAALQNSGMVKEAYAYGIPDPILDEKIIVDVIPIDGAINVLDIEEYCLQHLAKYKIPSKIQFVSDIKKTKNGKIQRKVYTLNE
ncbi:TPA: acyl--CoA ligase [Bacillus pseudomycoides]|nr:acyl--CoA ligase [Bacillus pseudomycoides]